MHAGHGAQTLMGREGSRAWHGVLGGLEPGFQRAPRTTRDPENPSRMCPTGAFLREKEPT